MFAYPNGDVFIGSIDTIGERKDAHYICNASSGYIETIGLTILYKQCFEHEKCN
jgi:hypothetical protein